MSAEVMPEKTFQGMHIYGKETNPIFYRRLEGKIAIVTGAAGGIGAATVRLFIADAALYLASDESRYVSGHNLVVDGAVTTTKNCVNL